MLKPRSKPKLAPEHMPKPFHLADSLGCTEMGLHSSIGRALWGSGFVHRIGVHRDLSMWVLLVY